MKKLDLIKKETDLNDGRYSLLTIKSKGEKIVNKAMKKFEIYNSELLKNYSEKELITLDNTLEIFINKIKEQ